MAERYAFKRIEVFGDGIGRRRRAGNLDCTQARADKHSTEADGRSLQKFATLNLHSSVSPARVRGVCANMARLKGLSNGKRVWGRGRLRFLWPGGDFIKNAFSDAGLPHADSVINCGCVRCAPSLCRGR